MERELSPNSLSITMLNGREEFARLASSHEGPDSYENCTPRCQGLQSGG